MVFSFKNGKKQKRSKKEKRTRDRTVAVDESGNFITDGSKTFTVVATVIRDTKEFEKISEMTKTRNGSELKAYDAGLKTQKKVLNKIVDTGSDFYGISYNKSEMNIETPDEKKEQYMSQIYELLDDVFREDARPVVDLMIDNNTLIAGREEEFIENCSKIAKKHGKEIDWNEMKASSSETLLQVHDYVTYAVGSHYEHEDNPDHPLHELYDIIEPRIKGKRK